MNYKDLLMHPVKEVNILRETIFMYEVSTLVLRVLEVLLPLREGSTHLRGR